MSLRGGASVSSRGVAGNGIHACADAATISNPEHPILVLAPLRNDARLTAEFLAAAGLRTLICSSARELSERAAGDCGVLLIAEEALDREACALLSELLAGQPRWSDLPIAIITSGGEASTERRQRLSAFGRSANVALIERPVRPATLVSTLEVALRSRQRQYQVRDLLEQTRRDAEALRDADRRKDEFLAMLAHELRNPLSSVGNAATLLQEGADREDHEWAADVIQRQTRQLARLVDDLLDVSRITRGKIELRKELLDAATCLESACEAVAPHISERCHTLIATIPHGKLWLEADPTRLEQIVVNLLANAAKYTEPHGKIWLEARRADGEIVIEVRDSGIGIHPDKIPSMFELFAQGERSIARSEGGLGIGLTVVRGLCELHGGTVTAESPGPGAGSTFTVHLPAAANPARVRAGKDSSASANGAGLRLLVVDDNVDTAAGLNRLLTRRGYDVRVAHDGPSAIEIARTHCPAVVLLDIGLPGMDGYEVARHFRADPACSARLIIALSGYGQDEDRRRSSEAGFDHHLVKPVEIDEICTLLPGPTTAR